MPAGGRRRAVESITVQALLDNHGSDLGLSTEQPVVGLQRTIEQPAINRPGLALAGFTTYFANKRIQVFGNSEISYLETLPLDTQIERFSTLCDYQFPCLVIARSHRLHPALKDLARERNITVISCPHATMRFINQATIRLEREFAPRTVLHGCMVDYRGIGILITGESGSGKSETAVGLLEKGGALVADDAVELTQLNGELIGTAKEFARGYLEMRGIGIINVANLFGLSAIRTHKRLDLVVELKPASDLNKLDRLGLNKKHFPILDQEIPHVEIPVAPGRDTARLIGVAALDLQLRRLGFDMADEFNQRLRQQLQNNPEG